MAEGRVDGEMIEIGDPTEEATAPESSPTVVIQYHERGGVPWMLIPPLLVLSAVGAIVLYIKFSPARPQAQVPALVREAEAPGPTEDDLATPEPPARPPSAAFAELSGDPPPQVPAPAVAPGGTPAEPAPPPSDPAGLAIRPDRAQEPQGVGFDPRGLEADRKIEAPADPALAPAAREDRPEAIDKPREVDPDLLPPDPREARARQQQRRVNAFKKVDEERSRYHAELKVICKKFGYGAGPEILELNKHYDIKLDPIAEKRAAQLLGKSGAFVGADRRTRVELLRSLGYPEPVILDNLFLAYEKRQIGERDGPRNPDEAYYLSALLLLKFPPASPNSSSRPVSATPRLNPPTLGNGAGPTR